MSASPHFSAKEPPRTNALSERLRQLRVASGMSQAKLAERMVLSRTAITQIEAGNREITADELARFGTVFGQSPSSLLASWENPSERPVSTRDTLLDELLAAYPSLGDSANLRSELERLFELASLLTEVETELGADVYGPEAFVFRGASPQTPWESAHQGYAAAEDERRRLDLGSAPIRDMAETLATLRIRTARLPLPPTASCVSINTPESGPIIVVDERASLEGRRFWLAHGFAHVLFDTDRTWTSCGQDERGHHHEVRANAFASRFLLPTKGVERYLQSIGRDTMAQSLGSGQELLSEDASIPANRSRVRLSARFRRGAWELNAHELSQVAHYFGVGPSLVAHTLRNLRFLSGEQRDRLTDDRGASLTDQAWEAIGFSPGAPEPEYDPFLSRLLALATEARRRGTLSKDRLEPVADLLRLDGQRKSMLLGVEGAKGLPD